MSRVGLQGLGVLAPSFGIWGLGHGLLGLPVSRVWGYRVRD